jgi:hypothetical protein
LFLLSDSLLILPVLPPRKFHPPRCILTQWKNPSRSKNCRQRSQLPAAHPQSLQNRSSAMATWRQLRLARPDLDQHIFDFPTVVNFCLLASAFCTCISSRCSFLIGSLVCERCGSLTAGCPFRHSPGTSSQEKGERHF